MAQLRKYEQVMTAIERRVRWGDYLLHNIPGERKIAQDSGVSYMTARRAISELLEKGVLIRRANGALDVHPGYTQRNMQTRVVLLYPAYPSPYFVQLRTIVSAALEQHRLALRPVQYVHWDDPIVLEAVTNAGGALIIPSTEEVPAWILASIRDNKVVVLDGDLSADGVPSIRLFPDRHIEKVFEHMATLEHHRIDCVNTQGRTPEIDRRIELWRKGLSTHAAAGRLWDEPAPSFRDPTPYAHEMMGRLIDEKRSTATAFVCTTFPAAIGVIRALWERRIGVGTDISVCSINIEPPARYCCPSIAGLDVPDLSGILTRCLAWFSEKGWWRGAALLEPVDPLFFAGESVGPPTRALVGER